MNSIDQNYYHINIIKLADMSYTGPRCPNGILAKTVCVTQKCNACPYICESNINCVCSNAHLYCKKMNWLSVLKLFSQYRKNLAEPIRAFMQRIQKIYNSFISKANSQLKIFYQYIQQKLFGPEYSKIMHFLQKQEYKNITCFNLGTIISIMTEKTFIKDINQEGKTSMQSFTLNQMKNLDKLIENLLSNIQCLYKQKFNIIQKQIREINMKQQRSYSSKSMSSTQFSCNQSSNRTETSKNIVLNKNNSMIQNLSNVPLTRSSIIMKRCQSSNQKNNFYGTSSTFFNTKAQLFKGSELASTKQTQFFNPQFVVKIDLTYPKTIPSRIISNASAINHMILSKVKEYKLIYRASENNFQISQFYKKMRYHSFNTQKQRAKQKKEESPLTLLLVKTQFGKVIGGFTRLRWHHQEDSFSGQQQQKQSSNQNYKQDVRGTSFFFSIDLNQKFKLLQPRYAIYCGSKSIGFGKRDLRIVNHAHKHSKNYIGFPSSYNNGLYLPIKKSNLTLSGSHGSSHFKVTQWEIFEIILKKQKNADIDSKIKQNECKKSMSSTKIK